jgi:glutathione S-transferase
MRAAKFENGGIWNMRQDAFLNGTASVTAFDWVPAMAHGFVRDLRLRWALEEAGFAYEAELLPQGTQSEPANLARQPFGQVPTLTIDGRTMFESGACVWRIAEASDALLPTDEAARDSCFSWHFAALDTMEKPLGMLAVLRFFASDREAAKKLEPQAVEMLSGRLQRFADVLGDRHFLVADRFTVADLMMTFVLRSAERSGDLDGFATVKAYVERHASRPAFLRALEAQLQPFRENAEKYERAA